MSEFDRPLAGLSGALRRAEYRVALTEQLRASLAEHRVIDLREQPVNVLVVFADEPVGPVWHQLAEARVAELHLFVAPVDFSTGRLTMVTLHDGSPADDGCQLADPEITFGMLMAAMTDVLPEPRRVTIGPDLSGFGYTFGFADVVEI